jgi:hypothetical protein
MRRSSLFVFLAILALNTSSVHAQFDAVPVNGITLGEQTTQKWKCGVLITAAGGPCTGILATVPVPTDWPEQQVRIDEEDISPNARVSYRMLDNGVKQMLIGIPSIPAGQTVGALVTFEVTKAAIIAPKDVSVFKIPKRAPRSARSYLSDSPYIEVRNSKIRKAAREAVDGLDDEAHWEKVEAIYDWVRDRVEYKDGKLKGALAALNDGNGDCEELTSLFIALCRVNKIPARTVWVPGHCYPEFMLVDNKNKPHWFPCQAAGTKAFGEMPDQRPILQKGDNFRVPEKRKPQRYVAELLQVNGVRGGQPKVKFVRQLLP